MRPPLVERATPDGPQQLQFAVASDERRPRERTVRGLGGRLDGQPRLERLGLPFRKDRLGLLVADRVTRRPVCVGADDDPARRRRRLQTRRRIDDVACREGAAGARVLHGDDGVAGVHGRARREVEPALFVHLVDPFEHAQTCANSPLGVVTVRDRRAEDGHHRVADEFLDDAAVLLDAALGLAVVKRKDVTDVLWVGLVRARVRRESRRDRRGDGVQSADADV